jgi:hypothetical protein
MTINPIKYGIKYKIQDRKGMLKTSTGSSSVKTVPIDIYKILIQTNL